MEALCIALLCTCLWPHAASAQVQSRVGLAYQLTYVDTGEPFPSPDGKQLVYVMLLAGKYLTVPAGV